LHLFIKWWTIVPMKQMTCGQRNLKLPVYFPDATRAVVRTIDSHDLRSVHVEGIVMNPFHLWMQPGMSVIKKCGGIKNFTGWDGIVVTDSGGFQVFSLIQQNPAAGRIHEKGITFNVPGKKTRTSYMLTPETSIQLQFDIGSDIMFALDYFTPLKEDAASVRISVDMTIDWARRSKHEYESQIARRNIPTKDRPLLFGIIQGGHHKNESKRCAEELLEIGFDGFGLGGFLFDENNDLDLPSIEYISSLTPSKYPRFALGVGYPEGIVSCHALGFDVFDCVLPTRDARHHRLYTYRQDPRTITPSGSQPFYSHVYIMDERYIRDEDPISQFCDCHTCQTTSRAYLRHLFSINDASALRLATIHNLRMYTQLIERLRELHT
jgi:queuine tRNA-ribosyltransferase